MKYKATDVAVYIVKLSETFGDEITPLRLQKLLYYVQGTFLALKGEPAFSDEILAWKLGPAVYSVFTEYKKYGRDPIPSYNGRIVIDESDQLIIKETYSRYRGLTTAQLVEKTHSEAPWSNTADQDTISNESIRHFFTMYVYNNKTLFSDTPVVTELPKELYDPSEDEEWSKYK